MTTATAQTIASGFPFDSKYIDVLGTKMHYIDEGSGDPILFLHGNPTSSYLWRNIIPHLQPYGRCIAPDLIGMGKSDKPELAYRFFDHVQYIDGFIERLKLTNLTLVIHDWGSGLGFHYAQRHPDNIKGIAFMEALVRPLQWSAFPKDFKTGFKLMRTPGIGWLMLSVRNMFITQILPQAIVRALTTEEQQFYRAPYTTIRSRKPVRQWPCELPIDGKPADVTQVVESYSRWLQQTDIPKLLFYAEPGGLIDAQTVEWCRQNFPNLATVNIGSGLHFLQEDNPHLIGSKLADWYQTL